MISIIVVFFFISAFLIIKSPKWLKSFYFIWFLSFLATIQITYNYLSNPLDVQIKTFTTFDTQGKRVIFKIQMLNENFSWRLGSDEVVQKNNEDINIKSYLNSSGILDDLKHSELVICIGNSSHEGVLAAEEARATRRASNFAKWLTELVPDIKNNIHTLDLGVNEKVDIKSSSQRRLVIITIMQRESQVDVKQALYNGLVTNNFLPFQITDYSKFDFK